MKLSKRLQTIADMITEANKIYDVGCDHAYLDIYLANLGFKCVAIDVRKQIIENAKKNVCESGLEKKIDVILNDGLEGLEINKNDVVVLSGLGTKTILKIIKNQPIKRLIVQSNDNLYLLRKIMTDRNYYISEENIIFEDNKYYIIIKFEFGKTEYNEYQLMLGPKLLEKKTSTFIDYLQEKKKHFEELIKIIPTDYSNKKHEMQTIINYIKMALM